MVPNESVRSQISLVWNWSLSGKTSVLAAGSGMVQSPLCRIVTQTFHCVNANLAAW